MSISSVKTGLIKDDLLVGNTAYIPATLVAIATSSSTAAATSNTGGSTWTARTMPSAQSWAGLAYGQGKFVVFGNNASVMAYSTDGITWTQTSMPSTKYWNQAAYNGTTWVTVGQNDPASIAVSTNGTTWTTGTAPSVGAYAGVAWGNGVFVMDDTTANAGTYIAYSSNGSSWTTLNTLTASGWTKMQYGANGGFIAPSWVSGNKVAQSQTGTGSWTNRTLPYTQQWGQCLAYGNGTWSYFGYNTTQAAYSTDGITWTAQTAPASAAWLGMWYSAALGKFVAVASGGTTVATSTTGTGSWTIYALPSSADWSNISSDA